jgi:hypothetical protein
MDKKMDGDLGEQMKSKNGVKTQEVVEEGVKWDGKTVQLKTMKPWWRTRVGGKVEAVKLEMAVEVELKNQTADTKKNTTVEAAEVIGRKMKTGLRRSNGKTLKADKVANDMN